MGGLYESRTRQNDCLGSAVSADRGEIRACGARIRSKHVRWCPDQKELFYNPRPNGFEAIGITTQPTFAFGNPVALPKKLRFSPQGTRTPYDVTPDGKFVGVIPWGETRFDQGSDDHILVVLNWFEELKAHVHVR